MRMGDEDEDAIVKLCPRGEFDPRPFLKATNARIREILYEQFSNGCSQ